MYNVYEWNPTAHSGGQWHVVDIDADGTWKQQSGPHPQRQVFPGAGCLAPITNTCKPRRATMGGWVKLGPGPQSDATLDGGSGVWMNPSTGNGYPYLQIHYLGFENTPESFDAFRVVQIDGRARTREWFALALGRCADGSTARPSNRVIC